MALSYNTVQAMINDKYLPILENVIFSENHYLFAKLKQNAKTFNERKIVVPLEYAKATNTQFMDQGDTIPLKTEEIATAAEYDPKMLTSSLTLYLEEELQNKSDQAIANIMTAKMKNVQRSMQDTLATHFWLRGTTLTATKNWNTMDILVNDQASGASSVGGIAITDTAIPGTSPTRYYWASKRFKPTGATVPANLVDSTHPSYLPKILQKLVAKAKYLTGEKPDVIIVPQYIWDLLEIIFNENKQGTLQKEMVGTFGFNVLKWRNSINIVADDDMVAAQSGDADGRIYALNMRTLYMFWNSGAKFTATPFVPMANSNTRAMLINLYGNLVISNRAVQAFATDIYSPKDYSL